MTEKTALPGETPETQPAVEPQKPEVPSEVPTEEPFDKDRAMATIHSLREIEKQAKKERAELEQLRAEKQKQEEDKMSESQKLQKRASDAEAEAKRLKAEVLRRDVIAKSGLPAAFADRLKGETEEEMLADAETLKAALPKGKVAPAINPTNPSEATQGETDAQRRARIFGTQQRGPWDNEAIRAGGGGVVWPTPKE